MDREQFDRMTKRFARGGISRRSVASLIFAVSLASVAAPLDMDTAEAKRKKKKKRKGSGFSPPPPPPPPASPPSSGSRPNSPPSSPPVSPPPSPPPPPPPPPPPVQPGDILAIYDVSLQGAARVFNVTNGPYGPTAFSRTGELIVRAPYAPRETLNGNNSIEICFKSGDPRVGTGTGAILFGTNDGCFGNTRKTDQAYVSEPAAGEVFFTQDLVLANTCQNIYFHGFSNARYAISDGGMLVKFSQNYSTVQGVIQADGLSNCVFDEGSRYEATFSGQRRQ